MDPRLPHARTVSRFLRQMNNGLDDVLFTLHRMESVVQEAHKMAPAWRQLRDALKSKAEDDKMETRQYKKSARPRATMKRKKRRR